MPCGDPLSPPRSTTTTREIRVDVGEAAADVDALGAGAVTLHDSAMGVAGAAAHMHAHPAHDEPDCPYCQLVDARHWREPGSGVTVRALHGR